MQASIDCYSSKFGKYNVNNALVLSVNDLRVWFSYNTIVAFSTPKAGIVCSENNWGVTTGRHLNAIQPDKKKRIPYEKFKKKINNLHTIEEFVDIL